MTILVQSGAFDHKCGRTAGQIDKGSNSVLASVLMLSFVLTADSRLRRIGLKNLAWIRVGLIELAADLKEEKQVKDELG